MQEKVSMAGIFTMLCSCLDMENIILGKYHYMMYYLGISLYPKMLFTLDENLELLPVNVRVG
jgi:26S proteasome regulatory subunit N1